MEEEKIKYGKKGFTLIELLLVIAIIGLLSSLTLAALNSARDKARASKIARDLRAIQTAFALWQQDTGANYQHECKYKPPNTPPPPVDFGCSGQAAITNTDLYSNVTGKPGWNGPYLNGIPRTPFKVPDQDFYRPYSYDYDGDIAGPGGAGGANIIVVSCSVPETLDYLRVMPILDEIFDKSDGKDAGRMRWNYFSNFSVGSFTFNIDPGIGISCGTPN